MAATNDKMSKFLIACEQGDVARIESLYRGLRSHVHAGVIRAIDCNQLSALTALCARNIDLSTPETSLPGRTPLIAACEKREVSLITLLLTCGAQIDGRQLDGSTALHICSANNDEGAMRVLLEHGADVNARDNDGNTPLHRAVSRNREEAVQLLLGNGADSNLTNRCGNTPSAAANVHHYDALSRLFIHNFNHLAVRRVERDELQPLVRPERDPVPLDSGDVIIDTTKVLGNGALGIVYQASLSGSGAAVAAKTFFCLSKDPRLNEYGTLTSEERDTVERNFRRECAILSGARNRYIVAFIGYTITAEGRPQYLIVERLTPPGPWNPREVWKACAHIARALVYLHGIRVIHRDVKPGNILYDANNCIYKLSDLGESQIVGPRDRATRTMRGSLVYLPPEIMDAQQPHTVAIDVFSFGVSMLEMHTNHAPQPGEANSGRLVRPEVERRVEDLKRLPDGPLKDLIYACLSDEPADRPTAIRCQAVIDLLHCQEQLRDP